ncbi:hypothetical protein DP62_5759 [Burkholderia pseudomallei]|nr:hypothetical protein DP62_5759 [Burkholderia pseudomallei]KGW81002.1 hypothetical protein Y048_4299 [Burkholderia pseudomallei MSHR456]
MRRRSSHIETPDGSTTGLRTAQTATQKITPGTAIHDFVPKRGLGFYVETGLATP